MVPNEDFDDWHSVRQSEAYGQRSAPPVPGEATENPFAEKHMSGPDFHGDKELYANYPGNDFHDNPYATENLYNTENPYSTENPYATDSYPDVPMPATYGGVQNAERHDRAYARTSIGSFYSQTN